MFYRHHNTIFTVQVKLATMIPLRTLCCALFLLSVMAIVAVVDGMTMIDHGSSSRRGFLMKQVTMVVVGGTSGAVTSAVANAYERRDVGDAGNMSATTAAFNEQAYKTNNRLEVEGFKLDTREEEKAKLSAAMASFSYDSSTTTSGSGNAKNKRKITPTAGGSSYYNQPK